jgi:hypothetical protein
MAEIATMPAAAAWQGVAQIVIEEDASPLVRLIGRTLGRPVPGHAQEPLSALVGIVAVRSHDTPQAATIVVGDGTLEVTSGVLAEPDATVVVDLSARFAAVEEPTGDAALAAAVLRALRPPLPPWRDAARLFWEVTRDIPGIPGVLVVAADGPGGPEREQLGDGSTEYVLSGADDFVASFAAGMRVKGTLSQLSVMTAAFWKVRFGV